MNAWQPNPTDGATEVPVNQTLSWNTGLDFTTGLPRTDVVNHIVYLSASNDPNLTSVTAVPVADTGTGSASYTPATELDRDAVYTWRVDEELADTSVITGPVWSFETVPSTPVVTTQPAVDYTGPGPDDSDDDGVFDADCVVDIYDFAYFASSWLECGLVPACL